MGSDKEEQQQEQQQQRGVVNNSRDCEQPRGANTPRGVRSTLGGTFRRRIAVFNIPRWPIVGLSITAFLTLSAARRSATPAPSNYHPHPAAHQHTRHQSLHRLFSFNLVVGLQQIPPAPFWKTPMSIYCKYNI